MARLREPLSALRGSRAPAQRDQGVQKIPAQRKSERISRGGLDGTAEQQNQPAPLPPKPPKRRREVEDPANHVPIARPQKRLRPSPFSPSRKQTFDQGTASRLSASQQSHISHWAEHQTWPEEYFQEDRMQRLLARPKLSASLRRKRSETSVSLVTPSDQRPREEKSAPYTHAGYLTLLEKEADSYMYESERGISDASKALLESLLAKECTTPKETLFHGDVFNTVCRNLQGRNEAKIIRDIAPLLVPSPETLAAWGATDLGILVDSVNAGWNNSNPITNPRPQPDFSVGFRESMFSKDQLSKMQPLLGDWDSLSYFRATWYMYFPFLTCEVKCGATGLDVADRQNAHSMTLAVRAIVELFKGAKRESEIDRELLTFSISHDDRTVRLYGYYPEFDGSNAKIYRHEVYIFDIATLNGKERWTTYKFCVAVYYHSLNLLQRIRSVIDDLPPDLGLESSRQSEPQPSEPIELSRQLENQALVAEAGSSVPQSNPQQITPGTSMQEKSASKKKKV